jgi:hypothetical protein
MGALLKTPIKPTLAVAGIATDYGAEVVSWLGTTSWNSHSAATCAYDGGWHRQPPTDSNEVRVPHTNWFVWGGSLVVVNEMFHRAVL